MPEKDVFAEELARQMQSEAKRRGIDPAVVQEEDVQVNRDTSNIRIRWKGVDIAIPAPSREAVDAWFAQNGQAIAGSVLTLAGVVVGGAIAIAAGKAPELRK